MKSKLISIRATKIAKKSADVAMFERLRKAVAALHGTPLYLSVVRAVSKSLTKKHSPIMFGITGEEEDGGGLLCGYYPSDMDKGVEIILILLVLNHDERFFEKETGYQYPVEAVRAVHLFSRLLTLSKEEEFTPLGVKQMENFFGTANVDLLGAIKMYDDGIIYSNGKNDGSIGGAKLNPFLFRIELAG